jgi:hypothetical protein
MLSACLASAVASAFSARVAVRRVLVAERLAAAVWRLAVLRRVVAAPRLADALRCALPAAVWGRLPLLRADAVVPRLAAVVRRLEVVLRLEALRALEALRRGLVPFLWVVAILVGPPRWTVA